ncbi:M67 family metallopeptidase [Sphingomonas canadensis]|uniref:M67 family metallopeptidase n=1 Tax=Sphingomonas canadensis TaxID=1219257 RepID=A0ABW3H9G9_9SPHN|nr:M67 family metallopeptidase [Sphingomonas canadensis]MCW3835589.1 M67 family metallopeptidase [Sphingomonas canadensis]
MRCRISRCVAEAIQLAAAEAAPREACGLLFGDAQAITGWSLTANAAADPETRFEIDPGALFTALRAERGGGPRIAGFWHSHPSGDPWPSATDAQMAAPDGRLWLIAGGGQATLWRAGHGGEHGRFEPVAMELLLD